VAWRPTDAAAHAGEQVLFRSACVWLCVAKLAEQTLHVLKNGNTYRRFPCGFFGERELPPRAAVDDAPVVSADDLVGSIAGDSVCGFVVVILDAFRDWLP